MMTNTQILTLDEALARHLNSHTVPISLTIIPACKQAIEFINRGEKDALVDLPSNMRFHNFVKNIIEYAIPAFKIAMYCHLDDFLADREAWIAFVES
jgi:hypothetical protein